MRFFLELKPDASWFVKLRIRFVECVIYLLSPLLIPYFMYDDYKLRQTIKEMKEAQMVRNNTRARDQWM